MNVAFSNKRRAEWLPMSGDQGGEPAGRALKVRLDLLGASINELADHIGVSREWVGKVLAGKAAGSDKLIAQLTRALDELEAEHGRGPLVEKSSGNPEDVVEFEVKGDFGVSIVVRGPVADRAELEQSVTRLIREMRSGESR